VTRLHDLYDEQGQSPWIDDLKRSYFSGGGLAARIESGVRGITSNPTIMAKAISTGNDYDDQFAACVAEGASVDEAYWDLVIDDINHALALFRPIYDKSAGGDGFVSLEVAPSLAHDTKGTAQAARSLHERIATPNLLVKIPATVEGVPAIEQMIAEGRSINVTLIFSLERYAAVIEAYLSGLEALAAADGDLTKVASVASFFVSRVDTEIDRRLEVLATSGGSTGERARSLQGKAAVAQAKLAYALFVERFTSERFAPLKARGARVQRPLWASTSTKNPTYPDLLYVDELIGPDTVNTMPAPTLDAFVDHGSVGRRIDVDLDAARRVLDDLAELGVSLPEVTDTLEREGVDSFARSFDGLIDSLHEKAASLRAKR